MSWFDTKPAPEDQIGVPTYAELMTESNRRGEQVNRVTTQLDRTEEQLVDARDRIAVLERDRAAHAHAAWLAEMRVAALEVAQRPTLGWAVATEPDEDGDYAVVGRFRYRLDARNHATGRGPGYIVLEELRDVQP